MLSATTATSLRLRCIRIAAATFGRRIFRTTEEPKTSLLSRTGRLMVVITRGYDPAFFALFRKKTKMNEGNYRVWLGHSDYLFLYATGSPAKCQLAAGTPPIWTVEKVGWAPPGACWMLYKPLSLYARFGDSSAIICAPIDLTGEEFLIYFDDVEDGLVAINNHEHNSVMDANGNNPNAGAPVTPWGWNGGMNQRWRFVPA